MKYLILLAVLAGSYYQFYLPKLNEESVREFVDTIQLADTNKDYNAMSDQLTETVTISELNKKLETVSQTEVTKSKLIKLIKMLKKPKYNSIEKTTIEEIKILEDKAEVISLSTNWISYEGKRTKRVSREVLTIITKGASFKVNEIGSYPISSNYL